MKKLLQRGLPGTALKPTIILCLPILLCSAAPALRKAFGPASPEPAVSEPSFAVKRMQPITDKQDYVGDTDLVQVSNWLAEYSADLSDEFEINELIEAIDDRFGTVLAIPGDPNFEYYTIVEDGIAKRVCYVPTSVYVSGGGLAGTVVVEIGESTVF